MTPSEMADEIALRLGDPIGEKITRKVVVRLMSRAQRRVADLTNCCRVVHDIPVVASQLSYALPDNFLKEYRVVLYLASGGTRTCDARRPGRFWQQKTEEPIGWIGGGIDNRRRFSKGSYYYIDGSDSGGDIPSHKLYLWPEPSSLSTFSSGSEVTVDTIRMWIARSPADISDSDGAFESPDMCHEAVMYEAVANAAPIPGSKIADQAPYYRQLADRALKEVKEMQTRRMGDVGQPLPASY
jgi:hypothetical protein